MRRALAALALLCALAPAFAAEGWEKFFELSLGDLREEAAEARKSGKQGLVVMYHFDDCPYCARMKQRGPAAARGAGLVPASASARLRWTRAALRK